MPVIVSFCSHAGEKNAIGRYSYNVVSYLKSCQYCHYKNVVIILSILNRNAHMQMTPRTDWKKVIGLHLHVFPLFSRVLHFLLNLA